jgi:hypothetical protein
MSIIDVHDDSEITFSVRIGCLLGYKLQDRHSEREDIAGFRGFDVVATQEFRSMPTHVAGSSISGKSLPPEHFVYYLSMPKVTNAYHTLHRELS